MPNLQPTSSKPASENDTSFRKVWDRDAYAVKALADAQKSKAEGVERAQAAAKGLKWRPRAVTPPDLALTEARASRIDVQAAIGLVTLVQPGSTAGRRGKGPGFMCNHCDLHFSDSTSLLDHYNSPGHLQATGTDGRIRVSNAGEVRERLRYLKRKSKESSTDQVVDLDARLELSRGNEEREREEKRQKRNAKRRKTPGGVGIPTVKVENDGIIC